MHRLCGVLLIGALLVAACDAGEALGGNDEEAMAVAIGFLGAIEAGDGEAAWSHIYPPVRAKRFADDRGRFEAAIAGVDLTADDWEVTGAWHHDGHYHVVLQLDPRLANGPLGAFFQVTKPGDTMDEAEMNVDIEPFGVSRGVVGG